jgi:hypothetical protein
MELEEELSGLGEFEHPEIGHEFESHEFEHPEIGHEFESHEFEHPEIGHEFESHEFEHPEIGYEFEHPEGEQHEWEQHEWEQHELEGELETGEQFFKRIARGIGRFARRAAPFLRRLVRVAAPIVGTAIGGPFGAVLGRVAGGALGEGELEQHEWEQHEWEHHEVHELEQHEFEQHELEQHEVAQEIVHHELTHHEALAEMMAEAAAHEQHEGHAEAMAGAAVITTLSPQDRRALRRVLRHMIRGVAVLTRILRRQRITRPAVRAVPTIVRRAVRDLKRQAAAGQPITRRSAARATVRQMQRVLGSPTACAAAIRQNVRATRTLGRHPAAG